MRAWHHVVHSMGEHVSRVRHVSESCEWVRCVGGREWVWVSKAVSSLLFHGLVPPLGVTIRAAILAQGVGIVAPVGAALISAPGRFRMP